MKTEMKAESTMSWVPWAMIIFIIFLVLKLTGEIAWSWWWVTSPLWIPLVVIILVSLIAAIIFGAIALLVAIFKK